MASTDSAHEKPDVSAHVAGGGSKDNGVMLSGFVEQGSSGKEMGMLIVAKMMPKEWDMLTALNLVQLQFLYK